MPAKIHMSKKELGDLIEAGKAAGNDTGPLEQLMAEITPEKPAMRNPQAVSAIKPGKAPQELVTSLEELERLRALACPHIRNSPYWEEFVSHRVLVCSDCKELRPGEFGGHKQPRLL